MKNSFSLILGWIFLFTQSNHSIAQADYPDHKQLTERVVGLADNYPQITKLQSLTKTHGNKDIWLLTIGSGEVENRPALAVVGGITGDHLLGSELALQFAEILLEQSARDPMIRQLLDSVTFYVFPDMSPDARAQYFADIRYERLGNANPSDLDRDGRIGEDPYNDLNGDGLITMMRISDPTGDWMVHPEDERVMVKARPEKGERGTHMLLSEGIDDDKDGKFNEDGEEGVFFNRNFTFNYPAFTRGAGEHAVSEHETRAIADFLFSAKNVFAVVSFGPANNLSDPIRFNEKAAGGQMPTGWQEHDVAMNQMVSMLYNEKMRHEHTQPDNNTETHTPTQFALPGKGKGVPGSEGDFFQWAYFHYGRYSFSTPGWWIPTSIETKEKEQRQPKETIDSEELAFLRWADQAEIPDVFIPWSKVQHPDFPGKVVEVGGIAPFVMKNPPYHLVDEIAKRHSQFIIDLAGKRPITDISNIRKETVGNGLVRITADIINQGDFPTVSQMGMRNRWVQKVVIRASAAHNQHILAGKAVEVIDFIQGNSKMERSWLITGKGDFIIRAGSESTGFKEVTIRL